MLKDYQFKFHQCKVGRFIMDSAKFQPIENEYSENEVETVGEERLETFALFQN